MSLYPTQRCFEFNLRQRVEPFVHEPFIKSKSKHLVGGTGWLGHRKIRLSRNKNTQSKANRSPTERSDTCVDTVTSPSTTLSNYCASLLVVFMLSPPPPLSFSKTLVCVTNAGSSCVCVVVLKNGPKRGSLSPEKCPLWEKARKYEIQFHCCAKTVRRSLGFDFLLLL